MIIRMLRRFFSGIGLVITIAIAFAIAIWFLGPLIAIGENRPFDGLVAKLISVGVIAFLALLAILIILMVRARRAKAMEEDIVESVDDGDDEDDELVKAELVELKGKLKDALSALRKSKFGQRSLYELPWYVMIGPPGAGKTTAIVNSGLQFPLAESMGSEAIGGVGGTRNCDWWFTDNAVLIDTAGRYTTQDSEASEDNAGWLGFLNLLKRHRSRQPINGAILAISLSDLSNQDDATQKAHAAAIRRRLHELREKLGVRFPVYVLFTKSDLIAGFSEFFDGLGKEERGQVWGFTLPLEKLSKKKKAERSPVDSFDEEFGLLLSQVNAQSLEKMQVETDHQRRALIASFPSQVASVRSTAKSFLAEVFQDNRFEKRHLLRGVYFTSGTQEGTPIDRLMMGMARTFGIGRQAIGSGQGRGRSFFLTRLFENVIFPEAGLVSADDKVERRYRWTTRLAIAAALVVGVGMTFLWGRSYFGNQALIAEAAESVSDYAVAAEQIPAGEVADSDLELVVPALNILRDMPTNPAVTDPSPDRKLTYGLYQGKVIGNQAGQTYRAALNQHLLPRLLLRLEDQMQANINNPDFLYEVLKVYLILGQQGPMDQNLVKQWMELDWSVSYAGDGRSTLREDLRGHLNSLLSDRTDKIDLNGPLIEQIRGILGETQASERIYAGIINSSRAKKLPPWRLTDIGGPALNRAIVRNSGKPLNQGIEGIYTYDGFRNVFLDEALDVARRIQSEAWVLGPQVEGAQSDAALANLSRDVLDLYYTDFISRYDALLQDVDIIPIESLQHAVTVTNVLSGPSSPIVNILDAVSNETKLTEDRSAINAQGLAEGATVIGTAELESGLSSRSLLFLNALRSGVASDLQDGEEPAEPGQFVEDRFAWLHQMVERVDNQTSQLDLIIQNLVEVKQELEKLSFNNGAGGATSGGAIVQFQEAAKDLDGPMPRWATQITSASSGITARGTRGSIDAAWKSQVLPVCTQALDNRYPFQRSAKADVAMQDFQKLFAPEGLLDKFFNENLREYVDTRARPWAWKTVNETDLGISQSVLQQFQYAAEIRQAFFASGPAPRIEFQITPDALDPNAQEVTLEIDGQEVRYAHSVAPRPARITWPGSVGSARIVLQPAANNAGNAITKDGPWALYRLLSAAEVRRTNVSDRSRVIFRVGGRIAQFQLQSGSVFNPFTLPALSKFSCPKSF
ncbi:MAG: type VI secretion system membrane subunit TssM [Marinovum sp.]|nr:type VI secretion system membrane subunit TssM [Marinovum sp.]